MFSSKKGKSDDTAEEELKTRPPYVEDPEAKESFRRKYVGKCYCGKVEIAANSDPVDVRVCHCRGCQRTHGASYQWSAFFHKHQILFTKGHDYLEFYNTETRLPHHKLPVKILCRDCHAPLADEGRRMMLVFPPVFEWEGGKMPDSFKPRCHMFYGSRTFDIEDGAPKFEGMKERSDTLPECEGDSDEEDGEAGPQQDGKAGTANGDPQKPGDANGKSENLSSSNGNAKPEQQSKSSKAQAAKGESNGNAAPEDSIAAHVKRQRTSAEQRR